MNKISAGHPYNEIALSNKKDVWLPGGSDGKELTHQCRPGFDPWIGKIPLEKEMATHSSILD